MRRNSLMQLVCPLLAGWSMLATTAQASDMAQAAAAQVSQTNYYDMMNNSLYTHTGQSRGLGGAQHDPARNNIRDLMISYGLSVTLESFTYNSTTYYNVVGQKTGSTYPTRIYILGAHFDSVSCPGADDNASGVAAILEAARILTQYDSACTIRFIAFDREEQGLIGSTRYSDAHALDDIRGMVSLDMVAYDPNTDTCNVYGRTASAPIKEAFAAAVTECGNGLVPLIGGDEPYSDHAPFEADGRQACLLIEGAVWSNPYYHTTNDSFEKVGNLNFPYAIKMTRSTVGWLVDAAGITVPTLQFDFPDGRPEFSVPTGGTRIRVNVSGVGGILPQPGSGVLYYNVGSGWQSTPMTVVADNVYDAYLPAQTCGETVSYYFSAQSQTAQTYSSPFSAPTAVYTATAAYGLDTIYQNTLDTNPGWTTTGQWAFGHPTGGGSHNYDPSNGHTGTNVYGYNLSGDYGSNISTPYYLTMPAINCTGASGVRLEFWRWLGVESNSPDYDEATIEVSNNGSTWNVIWSATATGADVSDASWTFQSFDISALADNQSAVRIRWGMGPTDTSLTYPGWNIDDVTITALDCTPPPLGACCFTDGSCQYLRPADCTGAYQGNGTDCDPNPCPPPTGACCYTNGSCLEVAALACEGTWLGALTACTPNPCPQVCRGDANCDDVITWRDIDYFVAAQNDNESAWWDRFLPDAPTCTFENCDVNADGHVTWRDIDPFVTVMNQTCP